MKKILIILIFIIGITACENQPWSFPDYDVQAVYFPIQTPVRTLSLGEDRIDNSLDKEFKFDIGVCIGGMYENTKDWTVDFEVDTTLLRRVYLYSSPQVYTSAKTKVYALPESYYTLTPSTTATIPGGSFNGLIRVELKDAFFNDTISTLGRYVIPLKITATSADSILTGTPLAAGADPRVDAQWYPNKSPKDWVMYGINYVNPYHGVYLHRGRDIRKTTTTGLTFDTVIYRAKYVEKDALIKMTTVGRDRTISNALGNKLAGRNSMLLKFENDKGNPGNITISKSPSPANAYNVIGTGHYQDIATSNEQWTGITWQSMYLSYSYEDGTYTHYINDTLVFRDRGIKYTTNSIVIQP